jgi:hypothetical protein
VQRSINPKGSKTVTTVANESTPSVWTQVGQHLRNWGAKVVDIAKRVGNWFVKGAKWLWNTKPVQWTVSKTQFVAGKVWLGLNVAFHYAKGPILWVGTPVLALWAMPTASTIVLGVGVLALAGITFFTWRAYRHLRTISTQEELIDLTERVVEALSDEKSNPLVFEGPLTAEETVDSRYSYLQDRLADAVNTNNTDQYAEALGRMHLLEVRAGRTVGTRKEKLTKDSSVSEIYRAAKKKAEGESKDFTWNWTLMYRAVQNESKRFKDREKLLREHGNLVPIK